MLRVQPWEILEKGDAKTGTARGANNLQALPYKGIASFLKCSFRHFTYPFKILNLDLETKTISKG
jgi:hypothetical protein